MSYNTINTAAHDGDLQQRLIACAAQEGHPKPQEFILNRYLWTIVAHANVAGPYASALAARMETPGKWDDVVTDGAILAVVQPLVTEDLTPPTPPTPE